MGGKTKGKCGFFHGYISLSSLVVTRHRTKKKGIVFYPKTKTKTKTMPKTKTKTNECFSLLSLVFYALLDKKGEMYFSDIYVLLQILRLSIFQCLLFFTIDVKGTTV